LIDIYADDAVLVIQPGMNAVGKERIRRAFAAIAAHFEHALDVKQAEMEILEAGGTALVLAKTLIAAKGRPVVERKATSVFRKESNDNWLCAIDNSYGHDLLKLNG
jgi:ketosteroid isomerase-like protein